MKKLLLTLTVLVGIAAGAFAQKLTYQVIVRDSNQQLVVNTEVKTTIKVHFTAGQPDYDTVIVASTNLHGLLSLEFGNATFYERNWRGATLKTSVVNNADNAVVYVHEQERPISAVPYALTVNGRSIQNYLDDNHYIDSGRIHDALRDTAANLRTLIRNAGGDISRLSARVDSLNDNMFDSLHAVNNSIAARIDTLVSDSLVTIRVNGDTVGSFTLNQHRRADINIKVQQKQKRFTATEGQTDFELGTGVKVDSNYATQFVINNQMVGTDKEGDESVITISGSTVTYRPAKNGTSQLHDGDSVQVIYFTKSN